MNIDPVLAKFYFPLETSGSQLTIVRLHNATPGIWTIIVHGDIILDGTYHIWLPLTGFVSPNVGFLEPSQPPSFRPLPLESSPAVHMTQEQTAFLSILPGPNKSNAVKT